MKTFKKGDLVYHAYSPASNLLVGLVCDSGERWVNVKWIDHKIYYGLIFYNRENMHMVRKLETHPGYPQ